MKTKQKNKKNKKENDCSSRKKNMQKPASLISNASKKPGSSGCKLMIYTLNLAHFSLGNHFRPCYCCLKCNPTPPSFLYIYQIFLLISYMKSIAFSTSAFTRQ